VSARSDGAVMSPLAATTALDLRATPAAQTQKPPQLMWMVAPMVVFMVVMVAAPIIYAVYLSFTNSMIGQVEKLVGLANYRKMLNDPLFWNGLRVTLEIYFGCLVAQLVLGVYLGLLLNRITFMQRLFRTALIAPFLMPSVVIGMMWMVVLDPSIGAANYLLQLMGLPPSTWLSSPHLVIPVIILIDTWQWTPFVALLVLGGVQTLPRSVYEAAGVDGISRRQVFLYITLPLLGPTLMTATVLRSVDLLRFFDLIYIVTNGGPGNASLTLNVYAFQRGIDYFDMGYASTLMIVLSLVVFVVVIGLSWLKSRLTW
jgi:multiple sugar transport system permease protein